MNKRQLAKKHARPARKPKATATFHTIHDGSPIAEPRRLTGVEADTAMLASVTNVSGNGQIIVGVGNLITYLRLQGVQNAAIVAAFRLTADHIEQGKI